MRGIRVAGLDLGFLMGMQFIVCGPPILCRMFACNGEDDSERFGSWADPRERYSRAEMKTQVKRLRQLIWSIGLS